MMFLTTSAVYVKLAEAYGTMLEYEINHFPFTNCRSKDVHLIIKRKQMELKVYYLPTCMKKHC